MPEFRTRRLDTETSPQHLARVDGLKGTVYEHSDGSVSEVDDRGHETFIEADGTKHVMINARPEDMHVAAFGRV